MLRVIASHCQHPPLQQSRGLWEPRPARHLHRSGICPFHERVQPPVHPGHTHSRGSATGGQARPSGDLNYNLAVAPLPAPGPRLSRDGAGCQGHFYRGGPRLVLTALGLHRVDGAHSDLTCVAMSHCRASLVPDRPASEATGRTATGGGRQCVRVAHSGQRKAPSQPVRAWCTGRRRATECYRPRCFACEPGRASLRPPVTCSSENLAMKLRFLLTSICVGECSSSSLSFCSWPDRHTPSRSRRSGSLGRSPPHRAGLHPLRLFRVPGLSLRCLPGPASRLWGARRLRPPAQGAPRTAGASLLP